MKVLSFAIYIVIVAPAAVIAASLIGLAWLPLFIASAASEYARGLDHA